MPFSHLDFSSYLDLAGPGQRRNHFLIHRHAGNGRAFVFRTAIGGGLADGHFEHTLGRLIRILQKQVLVPKSLEKDLGQALKLRNSLAHGFFRERAVEFVIFCSPKNASRN